MSVYRISFSIKMSPGETVGPKLPTTNLGNYRAVPAVGTLRRREEVCFRDYDALQFEQLTNVP